MSLFVISRNHVLNNEKSPKIVIFLMILAILQHFATKARENANLKKEEMVTYDLLQSFQILVVTLAQSHRLPRMLLTTLQKVTES